MTTVYVPPGHPRPPIDTGAVHERIIRVCPAIARGLTEVIQGQWDRSFFALFGECDSMRLDDLKALEAEFGTADIEVEADVVKVPTPPCNCDTHPEGRLAVYVGPDWK